mgnify:CR=1 FL=1
MKLGQTSILELWSHLRIFPWVDRYYSRGNGEVDAFAHYWTGFIANVVVLALMKIWFWLWISWPVFFFLHVILKEVILDRKKRLSGDLHEIEAFKVDLILRLAGFMEFIWIPLIL